MRSEDSRRYVTILLEFHPFKLVLRFLADLADAAYQVVRGGFVLVDGEEFEGRRVIMGAKN